MSFDWLTWSNPVSIWWGFLIIVSAANIGIWLSLHRRIRNMALERRRNATSVEPMVLLCAIYVFVCAFRATLPRSDVERICLFDTWLSSVALGRSVATVAELCFAAQWAIIINRLARVAPSPPARAISTAIVPSIVVAECCSWYAVITTNYLGNTLENSLWTATFVAVAVALALLVPRFSGTARMAIAAALVGAIVYAAFMVTVDVPMYLHRWENDLASGKPQLGLLAGLHDVSTRWVVTYDIARWHEEIAWMSLYFSVAVWTSLALCSVELVGQRLYRYRVGARLPRLASRRLSARPGAA